MSNKERTRQRLREAARTIFTQTGFSGASIRRITELAGYSRGAFYSNYSGKTELLLELLEADVKSATAYLNSLTCINCRHVDSYVHPFFPVHWDPPQIERSLIWAEATMLSARNPLFRKQFSKIQSNRLTTFAAYLQGLYPQANPGCDLLAFVLVSLHDGMSLLRAAGIESCTDDIAANALFTAFLPGTAIRCSTHPLPNERR